MYPTPDLRKNWIFAQSEEIWFVPVVSQFGVGHPMHGSAPGYFSNVYYCVCVFITARCATLKGSMYTVNILIYLVKHYHRCVSDKK